MWRWLFWAARMLATALLLSFLSIWTTGYIVNSYVETILKQLNVPLETKPFALSGVWGKLWGASDVPQSSDEADRAWEQTADRDRQGPSTRDSASSSTRDAANPSTREEQREGDVFPYLQGTGDVPDGASRHRQQAPSITENADQMDATGTGDPASDDSGSPPPVGQTDDSAIDGAVPVFGSQQLSSGMSQEQREAMRSIMSRLNVGQLSALAGYLTDGVTAEERTAIEELLAPSLSEAELQQLLEIIDAHTQ